jgi:hypothetical protein
MGRPVSIAITITVLRAGYDTAVTLWRDEV